MQKRLTIKSSQMLATMVAVLLISGCGSINGSDVTASPLVDKRPTAGDRAPEPTSDAPAAIDVNEPLTVGELIYGIPGSIDDYQLLTQEVVAENAMSCGGDPLDGYSEGVFWSLEGTFAKLVYVDDEGISNTRSHTDLCWTSRSAIAAGLNSDRDQTFPGVIEVTFGSLDDPKEGAEVLCQSTQLIAGCYKRYPGLVTAVSVKEALGDDADAQFVYLTRFLDTFVSAHPQVADATAGLGAAGQ